MPPCRRRSDRAPWWLENADPRPLFRVNLRAMDTPRSLDPARTRPCSLGPLGAAGRRWLALATASAVSLQAGSTWAQSPPAPSAGDVASADGSVRLFREGRQLLNDGRFAEACEKFDASLRLKRSPGTLLNVGNCLQTRGELTGALQVFEEALSKAQAEPDAQKAEAWSSAARREIASIEPRLARVIVSPPSAAGVRVALDGRALGRFGEPMPLDPGSHRLSASADGKASFERSLELSEGQTETVELPELTPLAPPAPPPPAATPAIAAGSEARGVSEPAPTSGGTPRAPVWIAGVGGVVLLAGVITGGVAAKQASDLKRECPDKTCEGDLSPRDSVHGTAVTADVLMATGLAGVAVGAIWLLLADGSDTPAVAAACDLQSCGASLRGSF
jgi:hypothetical protein